MPQVYRRYALCINKGSYFIWNYFDSKKSLLKDFNLYDTSIVRSFVFKNNAYISFTNF